MWLTVLVLALAVNFEPTRPTLVPLMLARPRPILQLAALFLGSFGMGLIAGLLVLFVFHQTPLGTDPANGARVQIAIGITALLIAAITASRLSRGIFESEKLKRFINASAGRTTDELVEQRPMDKVAGRARAVLRKGDSPWLSCALGLGIGLPSVDYLAVLVVIGASGAPPLTQLAALLLFLFIGNTFVGIPLVTYVLAPEWTNGRIEAFQIWIRARTRKQFAAVIALVGVMQILLGATTLWRDR